MNIEIKQAKISIGNKYQIFINDKETYSASTVLFSFLPEIELFENISQKIKYTLKKRWTWFETKFDIYKNDNSKYEYRTISFWKIHHKCQVGNDLYEIFNNQGLKYSVYKNNVQVAWWEKKLVTFLKGDTHKIMADDDCDFELLISFCLINDNKSKSNNGAALTINIGNNNPKSKKFDDKWEPKNCSITI